MAISLKADAGGTFGEILVNGSQVAKFTPGGNAVIPGAVGTVSQSSGIPTGAIIERGSNANGEFVRFADGTQICTFIGPNIAAASNQQNANYTWTFPAVFFGAPNAYAVTNPNTSTDLYGMTFVELATSSTNRRFNFRNGAAAQTFQSPQYTAIGRWF